MKPLRAALILIFGALVGISHSGAHGRDRYDESETRTLRETIPLEPGRDLIVDVVRGSIKVTATRGSEIRMVAIETIEGRDMDRVERARREVRLEIHQTRDGVTICQNGPFREPDDCTEWRKHGRRESDYRVSYDIQLEVPNEVNLDVTTVDGDIDVSGVRGDFTVHGVNGGIEMSDIVGSGTAQTVNGPVRVGFLENPREDSHFETVNGRIDIAFQDGLSADLRFKTLNGDVLSDFDYRMLPPEPVTQQTRHGRTIYKMSGRSGIRIASGGPRLLFENINGDILVRKGRR